MVQHFSLIIILKSVYEKKMKSKQIHLDYYKNKLNKCMYERQRFK